MEKLSFKEKVIVFFGFGYVVNENSKEIHRLSRKHKNCLYNMIGKRWYVTKGMAEDLILLNGYDGCKWCMKEYNTDE